MIEKYSLSEISKFTGKHPSTLLKYLNDGVFDGFKYYEVKKNRTYGKPVWMIKNTKQNIIKLTNDKAIYYDKRKYNRFLKEFSPYVNVLIQLQLMCERNNIPYRIASFIYSKEGDFIFNNKVFIVDTISERIKGLDGCNLIKEFNEGRLSSGNYYYGEDNYRPLEDETVSFLLSLSRIKISRLIRNSNSI